MCNAAISGVSMEKSEQKSTTILDFLQKIRGQDVAVTTAIGVWMGSIVEFDCHHLVIKESDGVSLLKIDEIIAIDWAPRLEITVPGEN
ncbi:MAG: DUF2642 domain-containing protein [Methanothrix sp.]|nr:MAG: DUF2642 domain-containing protein [Methanothrix sp.]